VIALGPAAARHQRRPEPVGVEIDLALDVVDLAGLDVVLLELAEDALVEGRAMRAGERGILDDRHRRVGVAQRHVDHAEVSTDLAPVCAWAEFIVTIWLAPGTSDGWFADQNA
jgi:hypothetical protein